MFNTSGIVEAMDASEGLETLTCKLRTTFAEVPFVLPLTSTSRGDGLVSRYHTNLNVLQSFFDHDVLSGLSGDSSFRLPAEIDVPQARVEFLDEDPLIKVQLDDLLNKTESNQKVYASYWRGQNYLMTSGSWLDYTLLGMSVGIIIVIGVMLPFQHARLRQLQVIVFAMQTQTRPTAALEFLVLRTTVPPSVPPVISKVDVIIDFTNEYWLMLLAFALGLVGFYKAIRLAIQYCPQGISLRVTQSFLVLQVFDGERTVYIRIKAVDGIHSQLTLSPQSPIANLILVGWILPVVTFTCTGSLENNITGVISCPERSVSVSWRQAWILRQLLQTEFRTELYLLTGDDLRVLRAETNEQTDEDENDAGHDDGGDSPTHYSPIQSQINISCAATQHPPNSGRSLSPPSRLISPSTVATARPRPSGDDIEMQTVYASVHAKPSKIYPRL